MGFDARIGCSSITFRKLPRAEALATIAELGFSRIDDGVGVVMDFSHLTASGTDVVDFVRAHGRRIRHVHVRDAVPGNIHISVGRGSADFAGGIAALEAIGYEGTFALELETRDVAD